MGRDAGKGHVIEDVLYQRARNTGSDSESVTRAARVYRKKLVALHSISEDQVKLAIQSGDKEKALQLVNQLVHPLHADDKAQPFNAWSGYPKYDEEWNKKRQDYKDQIMAMGTKSNLPNVQPQSPEVTEQQPEEQGTESSQPEQSIEPDQAKTTEQQPTQSMATIIADKAYFYEQPDLDKKRKGYLIRGQKVEVTGDNGNFYNCTYTAENGMKTDAWMLKSDLQR